MRYHQTSGKNQEISASSKVPGDRRWKQTNPDEDWSLKHLKVDRIVREALYSLPDESLELDMFFLGFEGWLQRIKDSPDEPKLRRISIDSRFSFHAFDVLPPSLEFLRMRCNFTNYKSLQTKLNLKTLSDLTYGYQSMTQFIQTQVQQYLTRLADIKVLRVPQEYFHQHIWTAESTQQPAFHEITLMSAVVQERQEWQVKAMRILSMRIHPDNWGR